MKDYFIENTNLTLAIVSTTLIFVSIYSVGFIIECIMQAFAEILSGLLGHTMTVFILNNLTFIGTVHHELSHALFALLTGAKITEVKLYCPENSVLGKVSYYPRGNIILQCVQCTLSAMAPVICGFITLYFLYNKHNALVEFGIPIWLIVYVMASIFLHMSMSSQDIKVSFKGLLVFMLVLFIIVFLTKFDFGEFAMNFLSELFVFLKRILNNGE